MHLDIRDIRGYYDIENSRDYDYDDLVHLGISPDNADVMTRISVPGQLGDFIFYEKDRFQKTPIEGVVYIQIGHYGYGEYGLYVKESGDEVCAGSVFHQPSIYTLNKNLRTFFLFHLIRNELLMTKRQGQYTSYKYAGELRKMYEQIDPVAMRDVEGYWSHLVEDYETGL